LWEILTPALSDVGVWDKYTYPRLGTWTQPRPRLLGTPEKKGNKMLPSLDPSRCPIVKVTIACDERECNDQGLSVFNKFSDLEGFGRVVECYIGG
jgi:hypothetical protein